MFYKCRPQQFMLGPQLALGGCGTGDVYHEKLSGFLKNMLEQLTLKLRGVR